MPDTALPTLNVAAYRFVEIDDPHGLRTRLLVAAAGLKGTILLAGEGINLVLAGPPAVVRTFVGALRADPRFAPLEVKESWSAAIPFERLLVKVKREIIRMNDASIRPQDGRAPAVEPATLARWLAAGRDDAGRELVMLDTRNAFEVERGAFDGALDWRLARFSDFPAALQRHAGALADRTVVAYCTGGIRCEKAVLLMRRAGLEAFQLEGGILRYLETTLETAAAPGWQGDCVVFDQREALDARLAARAPDVPVPAKPAGPARGGIAAALPVDAAAARRVDAAPTL